MKKNYLNYIKAISYAIEDPLQDLKQNLTLLNEIIYVTATVTTQVTITHEQNCFMQQK